MLDSGLQSPGFRIPQAKNSWIPESGFPYMGRNVNQQSTLALPLPPQARGALSYLALSGAHQMAPGLVGAAVGWGRSLNSQTV